MRYLSTRGQQGPVSLSQALAAGLADDGGLLVPESLPRFSVDDFAGADSLPEVAERLLGPFFAGDALAGSLPSICRDALDFPVTLHELQSRLSLLELFHGPTAAFKDVGARFLAACLARLRTSAQTPLTILVATSGDTGAAVAAAFHRQPGLRVVVLYPDGRVSPRQAHQLGCFGDNVSAFRVAGSFDDCQALVKQALNDSALQQQVPLSSANSISLGRLLPQTSYYALAALQHWRAHTQALNLIVPTGNLGNALAAVLVRGMGLPLGRIVLACNGNTVLPDYFAGGDYAPRASIATLANAMDVGAPSNFERLRWWYPDDARLRRELSALSVSDAEIRDAIANAWRQHGVALCPHTATACHAWTQLPEAERKLPWCLAATAHPAKFESVVEPIIAAAVTVPASLQALLARPAHAEILNADYAQFRARLLASR